MRNLIVGFCGYARSGKDTAAQALIDKGFQRCAFADALKLDVLSALQGSARITDAVFEGQSTGGLALKVSLGLFSSPATKEQFRPLLVEYGRAMRALDPDYWVKRLDLRLPNAPIVITDVRYKNEHEWIKSKGGFTIMIQRPQVHAANEEELTSLDAFKPDELIINGGDIRLLHANVLETLKGH